MILHQTNWSDPLKYIEQTWDTPQEGSLIFGDKFWLEAEKFKSTRESVGRLAKRDPISTPASGRKRSASSWSGFQYSKQRKFSNGQMSQERPGTSAFPRPQFRETFRP